MKMEIGTQNELNKSPESTAITVFFDGAGYAFVAKSTALCASSQGP